MADQLKSMFIDQLPVVMYFGFVVWEPSVPAVLGKYGDRPPSLTNDMDRIGELNNRTVH